MKEHPIIFSGEMVRAILEDRKTQTRRIIKPQPNPYVCGDEVRLTYVPSIPYYQVGIFNHHPCEFREDAGFIKCPYNQPGDRLWVRETFGYHQAGVDNIVYRAKEPNARYKITDNKWKPSIFMPRWASRINLEIVNIRVERVNDIAHEDAILEGFHEGTDPNNYGTGSRARDWFAELWDSINAKRGYGWKVNPWVWVIVFKRQNNI
jgi:hypothetical protein